MRPLAKLPSGRFCSEAAQMGARLGALGGDTGLARRACAGEAPSLREPIGRFQMG